MSGEARVRYRTLVADSARWKGFPFRPDDIVISTPAKCGTTWTQMICALLIFQTTEFDRPLDLISPWLDMLTRDRAGLIADLEAQQHRRFIKTHTPRDGLPIDEHVTYICVGRDPRDVALSWANHMDNLDIVALLGARHAAVGNDDIAELLAQGPPPRPESEHERFWQWIDDPTPPTEGGGGLRGVLHHLGTFWDARGEPNVVLLHYADLHADLEGQMRALAGRLGIDVPEARWAELVEAATFERMRDGADRVVPNRGQSLWQDNQQFFHRGTSGQWRELLDEADVRRYDERVRELADPALVAWVHQGAAALPSDPA